MKIKFIILLLVLSLILLSSCGSKNEGMNDILSANEYEIIKGNWVGTLDAGGTMLSIVFRFIDDNGEYKAYMDSPDQGATDIVIDDVILKEKNITLIISQIGGQYSGEITENGKIIGKWKQGEYEMDFNIERMNEVPEVNRPQEPKPPYNYSEKEIFFKNKKDKILLAGTITIPNGNGPFPAVVLVSGSGPQDRNEEVFGHKPFLIIADFLSSNGIAVLRYDDRGFGESEGDFSTGTTYDFAEDANAAFEYLQNDPAINKNEIGLIGHSEGGIIVPIVASRNQSVDFIILLAGTGMSLDEVLYKQSEDIMREDNYSEERITMETKYQGRIYTIIKNENDIETKRKELVILYNEYKKELPDDEKDGLTEDVIDRVVASITTNWFITAINLDPKDYLEKVECPVLALNGEKDIQVYYKDNLENIEKALKKGGNKNYSIKQFPNLNHLFQNAETGAVSEYAMIEESFSEIVLNEMVNWIKKIINKK